jgi:hypothetical protein
MARPVVLIYQEVATTTITPETPDLNCIIVGPCYWVMDYLDDKSNIQTSTDYGTKDSNNPYIAPATATDAITIADPPNNKTGALLDSTSVKVFFDTARVLIVEGDSTGLVSGFTYTQNSNIVTATGTSPVNFTTSGVKAGDYFIAQDPAGGGTDLVKRVLAVDSTTQLRTTTNFTATNTARMGRVERQVSDVEISSSFVTIDSNEIIVQGGVTTVLTGETSARTVNYAKVYIQYRSLRQDLRFVDSVTSGTEATTNLGKNDSRNPLAGAVNLALLNTVTEIQYFGVKSDNQAGHTEAMEVMAGRKDIYAIVPLTENLSIISSYKTEIEGLADVDQAESTGIPQKFRVVIGAYAMPTTKAVSPTSSYYSHGAHLTVNGIISGTGIATADVRNVFVDPALTTSTGFVAKGVRANDKLVIVTDTASPTRVGVYTVSEVYDDKRLRVSSAIPGAADAPDQGNVQYYIIRGTGTPVTGTTSTAAVATTGPDLLTADAGVAGLAIHVGDVLRVTSGLSSADNGDWLVTTSPVVTPATWTPIASTQNPPAGAWTATTAIACSLVAPLLSVTVARQATTRRCFRYIRDNNATFITDLVIATDLMQIPNPISGSSFTTVFEHAVAYAPSENTIVLDANEDAEAVDPELGDTALKFRISRTLTKDDTITALVSVSQSVNSRRVILVWPDVVTVDALVDGSKTRSDVTTPEAADDQPGYYLASIVGGMTAGLPSHQGFTNLGIAGVSAIGHSTRYFSDTQLTELSDGGWFVFGQETTLSLPYSIHQLTTDPSTLETGEYSVVKNFDYVSLFFQGILEEFLGIWNVNEETLGFLKQALNQGIDLLKLRKYAKIGAPLNSAEVTSVDVSTASADRVEAYMSVGLPKPLNRVGLHLVSV